MDDQPTGGKGPAAHLVLSLKKGDLITSAKNLEFQMQAMDLTVGKHEQMRASTTYTVGWSHKPAVPGRRWDGLPECSDQGYDGGQIPVGPFPTQGG